MNTNINFVLLTFNFELVWTVLKIPSLGMFFFNSDTDNKTRDRSLVLKLAVTDCICNNTCVHLSLQENMYVKTPNLYV